MKNMTKTKRASWLICAIVALSMIFSCLGFTAVSVHAETPAPSTPVTIADGQFNASGSEILKTSSSWTHSFVGEYSGSVVSGIIDLNEKVDPETFLDTTKLNNYKEYEKELPTTPFGRNLDTKNGKYYAPGTNSKVLMINVDDERGSAFGYKSSEISLDADSFYVFSVWAKTGSFLQNRGAAIKLSGLTHDVGFWNIDNSDELNNENNEWLGFSEYRIYVATREAATATLNLQVGDSYTYGEIGENDYFERIYPSKGYAFFDNVTAHKLSANEFYHETAASGNANIVVADFNVNAITSPNKKAELTDNLLTSEENGVIGSFKEGLKGWNIIYKENENSGQYLYAGTYDAGKNFDKDNKIGLESNPYTPNGNSDILLESMGDRCVAVLSAKTDANVGLESDEITIERNKFYLLSVYANTQNFDSDSNATLRVVGGDKDFSPVAISDVKGNGDINNRYGWKRYYFFIRGSLINNNNIKLQLWLGFGSNCKGTVLFDEVRFEEIPYSYYNEKNSIGTTVSFDTAPTTSIDNGRFFDASDYGEFPLKPSLWEALGETPEGSASGIILTDEEHYSANASRYFNVNNPVSQIKSMDYNTFAYPTMLLLASKEDGYFGYTSPEIAINNKNYYKLTVTMRTIDMTGSGANLWIEVDNRVISSIKNIKSTSGFTKYEFYFEGDVPFTSGTGIDYSVKLNIALGRADQKASGSIYVAEAAIETITSDVFNEKYNVFKTERGESLNYDMYSFSAFNFFGYDNTDTSAIKTSTNWTIDSSAEQSEGKYTYGVFDPLNKDNNAGDAYIPNEITTAYNKLDYKFDNVFTLQTRGTSATARLINPIKLSSNSYYLITVSMAVIINENTNKSAVGAGLYLNGGDYSDEKFADIRTTEDIMNGYKFVDYQFYVSTSDKDTNAYLSVSLGSEDVNSQVDGEVYIAYIACTDLGGSDDSYVASDTLKVIDKHVEETDEGNETDEGEQPDPENPDATTTPANDSERWWLIPSILFGIAIVLAVVGSVIRSLVDKKSRKQRVKELNTYDRRLGYAGEDEASESDKFDDDNTTTTQPVIEQDVEMFNDDEPEKVTEEPVVETKTKAPKKEENINDFDE